MSQGIVVETEAGRLEGRCREGVRSFLGIPFAEPPVGPRRFRPPRPPAPWSGVRPAQAFGPAALQAGQGFGLVGKLLTLLRHRQGEDCLYLNVWAPDGEIRDCPVMVWIHGGAFVLGAGSTFLYSGRHLATRRRVVVVTINYRLGALGFLDLGGDGSGLGIECNLGLRDQLAAIDWVRRNIAAFGGDPGNITLFGESAGAMSIGALLGVQEPPFRRAILQSGAAGNVSDPGTAAEVADRFLGELGLDRRRAERLRQLPAAALVAAQGRVAKEWFGGGSQLPWQPTVDGKLLTRSPLESVAAGSARRVELLVGTNRDEWKLFTAPVLHLRRLDDPGLRRKAARLLERNGLPAEALEELLRAYAGDHRSPYERWVALRTDEVFRIPAVKLLEAQSRWQPATFAYRFDHPSPAFSGALGACHGMEISFVFGTLDHPALRPVFLADREARELAARMQEAWTGFARDGAPGAAGLPRWPAYEPTDKRVMVLDRRCRVESDPGGAARRLWMGEGSERG